MFIEFRLKKAMKALRVLAQRAFTYSHLSPLQIQYACGSFVEEEVED